MSRKGYLPRKRHWWRLLNIWDGYRCVDNTPRAWWTRNELIRELCEASLLKPQSWEANLKDRRFLHFSERIAEYSWLALRLANSTSNGSLLDVGCVCNTDYFLDFLLQRFDHVHFLNLVSEPLARQGKISFYCQDLRCHTLPPSSFDHITCISTLEHVGGDNSYNQGYAHGTAELQSGAGDWRVALPALFGLLKPSGTLHITTPYGDGNWHDGEYRFSLEDLHWIEALAVSLGRHSEKWMMLKSPQGWERVTSEQDFDQAQPYLPPGANRVVLWEFTGIPQSGL